VRIKWCREIIKADCILPTLIHPTAYVSPKTKIEPGVVILPNAVVNTGTTVGMGTIINIGALIDHDCTIEEGCHICLGAIVKGENRISRCTKIEAGQIVERGELKL
jgi:UDP-3-O-[3-hydroxymyristoyl] glucosamine N-acyltransferase